MKQYSKAFIYFICAVSAMGGLLFGYDWVVIGGAKPFYELFFGISDNPAMQGWAMSSAILGCLLGATTCGALADRFGRKPLLVSAAAIFLISAYGTGVVDDFSLFVVARFIGGIAIGMASGLSPMYIAEVSPADVRGKLVTLNQMTIVLGILGAQIANMLIAQPIPETFGSEDILASWNGQMGWRWMFWAEAFPAALFLVLTFFIPESPRWIEMKVNKAESRVEAQPSVLGTLLGKPYRFLLLIGVFIAVFQQWCGTNVIFNYAQEIFSAAGYPLGDMFFNIVVTGIANVLFTFVALFTVDKLGRRALMLIGAGGLAGFYFILGLCYYLQVSGIFMIVVVVAAIACYAMSLGPVTWVLLSEIFPNRMRAVAMAVCTFALWAGCFTLTYSFPLLNDALGSYGTFWVYSAICLVGFFVFISCLPETKGKSLEELENDLVR